MYGFLRIDGCGLDEQQRDVYRRLYCGQCVALHRLFGYPWRMLVSHDAAFLGLLVAAQQRGPDLGERAWCALIPRRVDVCCPEELPQVLSACVAVLALSVKLRDSMQERRSFSKALTSRLCRPRFERARTVLASLSFPANLFDHALEEQHVLESLNAKGIEEYAEPSARLLAEAFRFTAVATGSTENESILRQIGYHVGKVIYLIDSCIDVVDDLEKERFNALLAAGAGACGFASERSRSEVVKSVIISLNAIRALAEELGLQRHQDLVKNVLLYGFPKCIHHRIERSIRELRENSIIPLRYLPHTALASALCLFLLTTQTAEASGCTFGDYGNFGARAYGL